MTLENRYDETDARLTAYAFGELEGEELAAMEAAVAADPLLAMRVEELRAFGGELGAALANEPAPAPVAVEEVATAGLSDAPRGRVLRFPAWAWAVAGLAAAAGVAVIFLGGGGEPAMQQSGAEKVATAPALPGPDEAVPAQVVPPVLVSVPDEPENAKPKVGPATEPEIEPVPMPAPTPALASPEALTLDEAASPAVKPPTEDALPKEALVAAGPASPAPTEEAPRPAESIPAPAPKQPMPTLVPDVGRDAPALASAPVAELRTDLRTMLNLGRNQYAAGDLAAAVVTFDTVRQLDARNREATYFSNRIEKEKARAAGVAGKSKALRRSSGIAGHSSAMEAVDPNAPTSRRNTPRVRGPGGFGNGPAAEPVIESDFVMAASEPVSTFAVDVDTAGYAVLRRYLHGAQRRPGIPMMAGRPAVRIEELLNYFPYQYAPPPRAQSGEAETPFAAHLAVASAPWAPDHRLVRIGIKAGAIAPEERPAANLVFVIDISASMSGAGGLGLVKLSMLEMLGRLRPDDHLAITTFDGRAHLVLRPTPVARLDAIQAAIKGLRLRGATNGSAGLELAYDVAREHFRPEGVNRVILCTDGGFNQGVTGREELLGLIQEKARSRVFLTVLGFGMRMRGSDERLEMLANKGNGVYGFVDSLAEARKILVDEIDGTLATVAKDVKIQVEFNPRRVSSYRLIGYENRALENADFTDDEVDAGEVGSGHAVTALYEITPTEGRARRRAAGAPVDKAAEERLCTLRIRHKTPRSEELRTAEFSLADRDTDFKDADEDFRFAAAVAAWGLLLRESPYAGAATFDDVSEWAEDCLGYDPGGYRKEFLELVRRTGELHRARGSR